MGQRASNTAGVTFEDVVVPKEVMYMLVFRQGCWNMGAGSATVSVAPHILSV